MSLINKMLQDLDARGGAQAERANVPQMRPVAGGGGKPRAMLAAGAGLAIVLLAAAGWLGWRYLQRPPVPGPVVASGAPARTVAPAARAAIVDAAPAGVALAGSAPAGAPESAAGNGKAAAAGAAPPTARLLAVARPIPAPQHAVPADAGGNTDNIARRAPRTKTEERTAAQLEAELKAARKKARLAKAEAERLTARAPARAAKPESKAARVADAATPPGTGGVTVTSQQQGENAYRRGLVALQEGRVQEALSNMEQAVFLYPRHDTARQTLVGLLIENKRLDEAIRHLQFGLGLDPKQPQMAMILARLQIEKGGPAIETLQRTLPYAAGNGDYLAFLAGALQRAQRNREAAEQYQAALRLQPQNGVWWMGLGISLQADKRDAEAREAFTRARNSGNLSQELQSFVERKLQQLAR